MALAQQQKSVVVVGAGPAGCSAAAALACRGYRVRVFERRPEPVPTSTPSSRGYPMGLGPRFLAALKSVGLEIESVGGAAIPSSGAFLNGRPMTTLATKQSKTPEECRYLVDRQLLGYEMYRAAQERPYPDGGIIEWFWGHRLAGVDFDARTAVFSCESGDGGKDTVSSQVAVQYDLLVGTDGSRSAVRQAMVDQVAGIRMETSLLLRQTYKTFHGLPCSPAADALLPGVSGHAPRQYLYIFRTPTPDAPSLAFWKGGDGMLSGMMAAPATYDEASLRTWVGSYLPGAPHNWVDAIVDQTREGGGQEPSPAGQVVRVSQFHGPSCVLLGDAAHAVSSSLGQGCNLALESVRVFVETLDRVGLERAPAEFSAARVEDAHAYQTLEFNQATIGVKRDAVINGQLRPFSGLERALAMLLLYQSGLLHMALHKLLPALVKAPMLLVALLDDPRQPWTQVLSTLRINAALTLALGAAVLAGLGNALAGLVTAARAALLPV